MRNMHIKNSNPTITGIIDFCSFELNLRTSYFKTALYASSIFSMFAIAYFDMISGPLLFIAVISSPPLASSFPGPYSSVLTSSFYLLTSWTSSTIGIGGARLCTGTAAPVSLTLLTSSSILFYLCSACNSGSKKPLSCIDWSQWLK